VRAGLVGGAPVSSDTHGQAVIDTIRGAGGDVMPIGRRVRRQQLGETCSDAASPREAYQQVHRRLRLHAIDFDIEATELKTTRRSKKVVTR